LIGATGQIGRSLVADDYQTLSARLFDGYDSGRFTEALELVTQVRAHVPEETSRLVYWTACLRTVSGDPDGGLRALQEGLEEGFWFLPEWLRSDTDLRPLRELPGFRSLVEESERRWRQAQASTQLDLLVVEPSGPSRGVLVALHGGDGRADEPARAWESATEVGLLLAVPQSTQIVAVNGFGWSDRTITERDLAEVYSRVRSQHDADGKRIVVGGFSQGAGVAVTLAIDGTSVPVDGFVAVAPGFHRIGQPRTDLAEARRGIRGVIIAGEHDSLRGEAEAVHRNITRNGVACGLVVEPGLGHAYPADFDERLAEAIDFVLLD
jgi:pimeloyl-ACP methyl ester carboxylesterase